MPELILASTSKYRRVLLERLGVPFRCEPPRIDEEALKDAERDPRALAEYLAWAKAESVRVQEPRATIIGSDQLVACQGQIFGKPGTAAGAVDQLLALSGTSHELITALAVLHGDAVYRHTDVTRLHLRRLSRAEIERYVAADNPIDCAGSYKLEARGVVLFERVETEDQTAITGLPLIALTSILRRLGHAIP